MLDPLNEDKNKIKYAEVGPNSFFETMAFEAKKEGEFWDANTQVQINLDSPYNYKKVCDEIKANNGHIRVVEEIVGKLKKGEI